MPKGLDWQDLCRGPLDTDTYQIYKLWASCFQRRFFKKNFHYKSMGAICCHGNQSSNPISSKTLCSLPLPDDALHEI